LRFGYYPAAESPQLPLGDECFLPVAGCRVLEWSLRLLPEGLHWRKIWRGMEKNMELWYKNNPIDIMQT